MTATAVAGEVGAARYPGRAQIDAYGNGGFRFAGMSHRGSILVLPSGIRGWEPEAFEDLTPSSFDRVMVEAPAIGFLILGTGARQQWPEPAIRSVLVEAGIGLEVMDTGAAVRTYNLLLAEERPVGAALIAVASPR